MEMHIVHVKVDEADPMNVWDGLAVVGQMFEVNWSDENTHFEMCVYLRPLAPNVWQYLIFLQ